jgi:membrane peptidoglycan carboxypeptidase
MMMMIRRHLSKLRLQLKSIHPLLREKLGDTLYHKILFWTKWAALGFAGFILLCFVGVMVFVYPTLPDINNLQNIAAAQSSTILDREGNVLYTVHGDENRKDVSIKDVSPFATQAVLAIEDDQFYNHGGVDLGATLKAFCYEIHICSQPRGGSTITQQFIKNAFLSSERTYIRKLKEILLALELERKYTKDEILEMYLNRIPYGSSVFGIERAAETFFGKSAKDLTLAEGAILASIPNAPSYFSPYGSNLYASITLSSDDILKMNIKSEQDLVGINPDFVNKGLLGKTYTFGDGENQRSIYVKGRVDFVLDRMKSLGYIKDEEATQALAEANAKTFKPFREEMKAPHFVEYIRKLLEDKYGKDTIEKGGLKITTTLDPTLQAAAEKAVSDHADSNLKLYKASNASLVAEDSNSGQILAMVGSIDYWNEQIDGKVNVALRPRLPGSSFKPIVYAAAFLQGYSPSTILYDVDMTFNGWYNPENYSGDHQGPVTIRQALAWSLNVPAVEAGYLAGIPNVLDLARKMGIQLDQPDSWYGLSLALGAGEVRLLDMVGAYSIFANGGDKLDPVFILKVEDRNGNILDEYQPPKSKNMILDPQVAYLINNVLSDVSARPEGWWQQQLSVPGQIAAAKTGTSNKKEGDVNYPFDTWTMGYTRNLVAGVWAGNNDGSDLGAKADGLNCAAPIWRDFMTAATAGQPSVDFDRPEGIRWVKISSKTGLLPSQYTPEDSINTEVFSSFSVPKEYDNSFKMVKIDKVSGKLATDFTPPEAVVEKPFFEHHSLFPDNPEWEDPVRQWAIDNNQDQKPPTESDDVHTAETMAIKPQISITSPSDQSSVTGPYVGVWVNLNSKGGVAKVDYYWDDQLMDTENRTPFKGTLKISDQNPDPGSTHTIRAVVFDALYRSNESSITVKIGLDTTPPEISFVYPGNGASLSAGSSMAAQVDASDKNGDISKVDFYLDGQLQSTAKQAPYVWQFTVPQEAGPHTIHAVAYDYSNNKASADLNIISTVSEESLTGNSRILEPSKGATYGEGGRVLIKAYLDESSRGSLKELTIFAKRSGGRQTEVAKALGDPKTGGAASYTFIWGNVPAGNYDLFMRVVLNNDKIQFSEKVPIEVK